MALLALAAAPPVFADGQAWRRDFGLRIGGVGGPVPLAASLSAFCEIGPDGNWALRPSLEATGGVEWTMQMDVVDVTRVGAAMDLLYYASRKRPVGTGFFLTAGAGWHRFGFKYRMERDAQGNYTGDDTQRDVRRAASLTAGAGYQLGRNFGVEMKYGVSGQGSSTPYGLGRSWLTTSMNFRFSAPGRRKADRGAGGAAGGPEAGEPGKHSAGFSVGIVDGFSGAYSVFYEGRAGGRWAFRPAVQFAADSGLRPVGVPQGTHADRAGLSMDCVFYASKPAAARGGAGAYLLAGLGAYGTALKNCGAWRGASADGYGENCDTVEYFSVAPALSVGAGYYFGRRVGVEYRHTFSALRPPSPGGAGKNWWQLTAVVRFPAHGLP
jgi:hypothetical protein